jgi:hypothetical protein
MTVSLPKQLTEVTYVSVSAVLTGVYLLYTKDNQIYVTSPHGFDYFLNFILALQYSSAFNVLAACGAELSCKVMCHTRWINFWNFLFYWIFPVYAVLAAAAAGWYNGTLYGSIATNFVSAAGVHTPPGFSEEGMQTNSIIIFCCVCVLNFALLTLYLLMCYCGRMVRVM